MLGMRESGDIDMGEGLLEIDGPLDIPQDLFYNRGAATIAGSFLSAEQDVRSERVHAQIMDELNEVCDMESQTSKHKRRLDNGDSTRSRKSSRSQEETSIGVDDNAASNGCEQSGTTSKSGQRARPKHLCRECGKTFKRAHNLKIHGRLHSGDKPYGCPFPDCNKEFRWKSSIVSHLNWHRTKKGDVLPGNFASMHALILKKKKKPVVEVAPAEHRQETAHIQAEAQAEHVAGRKHEPGEDISEMGNMGEMSCFTAGLNEVGMQYEEDAVEKEEKDDATVLTPSTTSYQASPVAMEMGQLECLPVLEDKEWETRSEGCRSGLSSVLLPSLSCCRIESGGDGDGDAGEDGREDGGDGFGSFLEDVHN